MPNPQALRLMKMSKSSLYEEAGGERAADPVSQASGLPGQEAGGLAGAGRGRKGEGRAVQCWILQALGSA